MSFKELKLLPIYDKSEDIKQFYNDFLSKAVSYKRVSAYFNDGIFKHLHKGLNNLVKNDGKMKLILSTELDKQTFEHIVKGYDAKETLDNKVIEIMKDMFFHNQELYEEFNILSFLIAIGALEIRIAFKEQGIFHAKFAILEDKHTNKLIFGGSNNDTRAAMNFNYEEFEVSPNWNSPSENELNKIRIREENFDNIWENQKDDLYVYSIDEAITEQIIKKVSYEKIRKENIDTNFLVVDINSNDEIILNHFGIEEQIRKSYYFRSFIRSSTINNSIMKFDEIKKFNDHLEILNVIKKFSDEKNIKMINTRKLNKYLYTNKLDLDFLSKRGKEIKNMLVNPTDEFNQFEKRVNSLLKRKLRLPQVKAAMHIVEMKRSMNFSVPGSGKTASILGAFEYLNSLPEDDPRYVDKLLVIGPINCFKSWKDEYFIVSEKAKDINVDVIDIRDFDGLSNRTVVLNYDYPKARLILLNFESIESLDKDISKLVDDKTFVVFDEIHRIKRIGSGKYKASMNIVKNVNYRVALTGTPLPNGYIDLYNIFQILFGDYSRTYFQITERNLKIQDNLFIEEGIENKALNEKMYPFYIRTTKKDLNVPEANQDNLIFVSTTKEEQRDYFNLLESSDNPLELATKLVKMGSLGIEATSVPEHSLLEDDTNETNYNKVTFTTSKIKELINLLKKHRRKSIIWCNFVDTIINLKRTLAEEGFKVTYIYGATPDDERNTIIDKFNNTNEIEILITNPHTLAESVSLHRSCHDAYYVELNYNLAQYLQSRDRIHRLGLKEDTQTNYYILINSYDEDLETSIDKKIYDSLKIKENRMISSIERGNLLYYESDDSYTANNIIKDIIKTTRKRK